MRKVKFKVVASKNIGTGAETDIPAIKGEGINYDAEIDQLASEIEDVNNEVGGVKADLSQLATKTATSDELGLVKVSSSYGLGLIDGTIFSENLLPVSYNSKNNYTVISKGTLENRLAPTETEVDDHERRIKTLEDTPIPESTIQTAVDSYVSTHSGGFATKEELRELDEDEKSLYEVVIGKNLIDNENYVIGAIQSNGSIATNGAWADYRTYDFIPVKAGVSYTFSKWYNDTLQNALRTLYLLYDSSKNPIPTSYFNQTVRSYTVTPEVDGFIRCTDRIPTAIPMLEVGDTYSSFEAYSRKKYSTLYVDNSKIPTKSVLYHKRWAVFGDSFTNGATGTLLTEGKYKGKACVYPYIIGNNNDMEILKFFESGRTLAYPEIPDGFTNSVTCPTEPLYYQNVPLNVDYITFYLGINDEHHKSSGSGGDGEDNTGVIPLGTINDSTVNTYYGAWNVVLTWFIQNRPNAHIGIIVTNGVQSSPEYRTASIEIAKKFGIPYIDLNGDERTPAMIRTCNPNIPSSVKNMLIAKWRVSEDNTHPNDDAHYFESTFIENFLRSI